jgi:hypothetical protein
MTKSLVAMEVFVKLIERHAARVIQLSLPLYLVIKL